MSTTAALVEGHYLTTESKHRPNGVITRQAGCQCGDQFEWVDRDKDHALHLLDVVRADHEKAVRERIAQDIERAAVGTTESVSAMLRHAARIAREGA